MEDKSYGTYAQNSKEGGKKNVKVETGLVSRGSLVSREQTPVW